MQQLEERRKLEREELEKRSVDVFLIEEDDKYVVTVKIGYDFYSCNFDTFEEADEYARFTAESIKEFFDYHEVVEEDKVLLLKAIFEEQIRKNEGER